METTLRAGMDPGQPRALSSCRSEVIAHSVEGRCSWTARRFRSSLDSNWPTPDSEMDAMVEQCLTQGGAEPVSAHSTSLQAGPGTRTTAPWPTCGAPAGAGDPGVEDWCRGRSAGAVGARWPRLARVQQRWAPMHATTPSKKVAVLTQGVQERLPLHDGNACPRWLLPDVRVCLALHTLAASGACLPPPAQRGWAQISLSTSGIARRTLLCHQSRQTKARKADPTEQQNTGRGHGGSQRECEAMNEHVGNNRRESAGAR
ncbi:unnamed protein product [Gadus morhua 'NCC']